MEPPSKTALDKLAERGLPVVGIGKIENIFAGRGIARSFPTKSNADGMERLFSELSLMQKGLLFINLIDFDMVYGHRNDCEGYARCLEAFDASVPRLLTALQKGDVLIITADHGCDPLHPGTNHTREYVPLLVYSKSMPSRNLGIRRTFADVGASILALFGIEHELPGRCFLELQENSK